MPAVKDIHQAGTTRIATIAPLHSEKLIPHVMPRILTSWDMTTTFIVSTYLASCASTVAAGGPAAITYLVLVGLTFFVPCLIATAQLGHVYPHEGALYNWAHHTIGGYWSFFAGFCAWFPGVLISSSLASLLVIYATPFLYPTLLNQPWKQGIAICLVLAVSGFLSTFRFRLVKNLVNLLVILLFSGTLVIALACIIWLIRGHHSATTFTNWSDWEPRSDNIVMFGLLAFAYLGTEGPLTMAGEIKGRKVIGRHLIWGPLLLALIYALNTLSVLIVLGRQAAYDPFALVRTVYVVLGKDFAVATSVCLMASFLATILVYNYLYARLLLVASVDKRLPRYISKLNRRQVPVNAILLQALLAIIVTLAMFNLAPLLTMIGQPQTFSAQVYMVSQASAALVWTISAAFLFICLIGCILKQSQAFQRHRIFPIPLLWFSIVIGILSCAITVADTLLYSWTNLIPNTQWWYLVGGVTSVLLALSAFISIFAKSEVDWQTLNAYIAVPLQKENASRIER
ncbi:APC family permease [Dictyobacter kobayashii]|uniref:Amino acid permease n=1 Tax=Dictyobacter kobayashii TaxID=2014872 RepID=A0A402AM34_9CHLR|nr:APC family permease [Dictyobacter kobayashii]GCE20258.1 hypothetical protein KDK_40580 [Dictyobacter kobayashii]